MFQRTMHVLLGTTFVVLLSAQGAWAVSFGKMDVASKMGEPFYAEVPLRLNSNETLRKTSVELGSAADYRILEVYRNAVLSAIRTDIIDDERGVRVTLSSDAAIDEAFFNVVLKVRYGRSTHYKKIPVFLDVPAASESASAAQKPVSAVNAATVDPTSSSAFITKLPEGSKPDAKEAFEEVEDEEPVSEQNVFNAYDGWARTAKYGPMVYGDTITTVAKRLRLDDTFTNKQVMVALFEKNKAQFSKNNINLIKAGAFLDVPSSSEVAKISPVAAKQILSKQAKAWKAMQKDSKYAALAEAQRTRYSSRVRIGQQATGVAAQPASTQMMGGANTADKKQAVNTKASVAANDDVSARTTAVVKNLERKLVQKDNAFTALQEKMASLEAKLAQTKTDENGDATAAKPAADDATTAALDAQNKRLELVITRLKTQLEQAKTNVNQTSDDTSWMLYALIGLAVLVLTLLIAVLMLVKRTRQHPAEKDTQPEDPASEDDVTEENQDLDATRVMDADEFDMPSEALDETGDSNELDASSAMFGEMDDDLEEIPELTDEETGEMEPFNADEAPDPNVNYLEDADVYMRYGMEEEAEQQIRMALKLEQDNPEAHAKMVKVQKAKGDDAAMNEAIATAKVVLTGSALAMFETTISDEDSALRQNEGDVVLGDLPVEAAEEETKADDIDIGSVDFDESADGGEIDFDFSDIGKGEEASESTAVDIESKGGDLPDLDIDFDIADLGDAVETDDTPAAEEEESGSLISGELDEVEVEGIEDSDIEEFVDNLGQNLEATSLDDNDDLLGVDSIDFGDMDLGETAEVQLGAGTQLISTDGSDLDSVDGLNDFELDKLQNEAEAEKNATSVDVDASSADPFLDANQALKDKGESEAGEDWDAESIGLLVGEEEDELSLLDEKKEDLEDDGTADITLEDLNEPEEVAVEAGVSLDDLDMDFDLPDLDADDDMEETPETDAKDELNVPSEEDYAEAVSLDDTDVSLDDLDMDFDLPDLDADDETAGDGDGDDATFNMDAGDNEDSDSEENDNVELTDVTAADASLDDLDMDFDLPDLDADDETAADDDATFIMDAGDDGDALIDLDMSLDDEEDDDISLLDAGNESIDSIDTGLDDLDISTTTVDPVRFGLGDEDTDLDISMEVKEDELGLLADLDADLSELEMHEKSIISDVNKLASEADIEDLDVSELGTSDVMLDEADDLDKTFVLNDVEKNKEMLEEGKKESSHHFENVDDALSGGSSVTDDPMLEPGGITQELENIHTQTPQSLDTVGASGELDDLLKDLDGLLDEDKDKT